MPKPHKENPVFCSSCISKINQSQWEGLPYFFDQYHTTATFSKYVFCTISSKILYFVNGLWATRMFKKYIFISHWCFILGGERCSELLNFYMNVYQPQFTYLLLIIIIHVCFKTPDCPHLNCSCWLQDGTRYTEFRKAEGCFSTFSKSFNILKKRKSQSYTPYTFPRPKTHKNSFSVLQEN